MRPFPKRQTAALVVATALIVMPMRAAMARDGVTRREIKIGFHIPMTGAAPLPSDSAQKGVTVLWKWLRGRGQRIYGRNVTTVVKNDNYNPSQAVAVCKEMVEEDHVFMLTGIVQGSGVNQVQACARYAASVGVPYVSLGMTKQHLKLPRYFAVTATWPREARLVADFLVSDRRARRATNGIVWMNTPNFTTTHRGFTKTMDRRGATLKYDSSVPKNASQSDAERVITEMKTLGVDNVFVMTTPVWFLQLLQSARTHAFRPLWTGTSTIASSGDAVVSVGCRNGTLARSRFTSPLPAFGDRDDFDRKHDRAVRMIYDERGDAVTWLGWAGSKAISKLLKGVGRHLTRRRFAMVTERDRKVVTGIFPRFGFRPRDHFGGSAVHLLRANCKEGRWTTVRSFVRDF